MGFTGDFFWIFFSKIWGKWLGVKTRAIKFIEEEKVEKRGHIGGNFLKGKGGANYSSLLEPKAMVIKAIL